MYLFTGADYPFTKYFILSLTLRGIARNAWHTPRRAPPVTPSILLSFSHVLDCEGDPRSSTLFCAFLFTFYLMVRLANIVPKFAESFDPRCHISLVVMWLLLLMVYWSHLSVQKRFNLESGFSTFLCLEFTIRRYALFLLIYTWIRLVPARRSCFSNFRLQGPRSPHRA